MSRSIWKGPYVERNLLKKIAHLNLNNSHNSDKSFKLVKTWSRKSVILPEFVGITFQVYNGYKWISVRVTDEMIGHKLGEFSATRKSCIHKKKKKK